MSLLKYINRMKRMDQLIRMKATGTPDQFAEKMGICKSVLMDHISELKCMGAPIVFDRIRESYVYQESVKLIITYENGDAKAVRGGFSCNYFLNPIISDHKGLFLQEVNL